MALDDYNKKRNFRQSPEPRGVVSRASGTDPERRFFVQLHHASRVHYDFRIEIAGLLKSWAVPKGPSLNPQDQRLAVLVEDHPVSYGTFEGTIPKGNYGAGSVMLWDEGTYVERSGKNDDHNLLRAIADGHLTFILSGQKLAGEFALIRLKDQDPKSWLLVKKRDEFTSRKDVRLYDRSVKTGRTIKQITENLPVGEPIAISAEVSVSVSLKIPPLTKTRPILTSPPAEKVPRKIRPMLARTFLGPFSQPGWIFENDSSGIRTLAVIDRGIIHLYSKQHLSLTSKHPTIVAALRTHSVTAVIDGEIVTDQRAAVTYIVKDLLHLNGLNTRSLPLLQRKEKLRDLPIFNNIIVYCPHVEDGIALFAEAQREQRTGIIAKQANSLYHAGVSNAWLKISVPLASMTLKKTSRSSPNEKKINTDRIESAKAPEARKTPDKNIEAAEMQIPASLRLTHLTKIYWPEEKITKGDLIEYYRAVAPVLLPHLRGKPESLHRHPNGIRAAGFFQKNLIGYHPRWVETERIFAESLGKSIDYLICENAATLLYMANLGCIELNPWLSRRGSLDHPEAIVIDLDPDRQPFSEVIEVALTVHKILNQMKIKNYVKTSGASGLHIFIPAPARYSYAQAREFALNVCHAAHQHHPQNTSLERTPAKRRGKIYLDCLQNARGQTIASVYSVRPLPGAPVSTPLEWKELTPGLFPSQFTMTTVPERIKKLGDLWRPVLEETPIRVDEKFNF